MTKGERQMTVQEIEQALEQAKRNRATQENDCSRAYPDLCDAQQDYEDEKQLLSLKKSEVEEWEQRLTQAKEANGKPE